ncbi:hypothetical protein BC939DRAFT_479941 [Gamsiella multidivaricata]|uniref:uncharacterized protein n=1 Tax=Gamsiella multidivaricata TaxID=101098 RepID=UPI00221E9041|nr:uncharacterized protein BC939DRAFT_479941 [Gamsiella multidivaricata]KAI7819002.1 hypothetical protein BC939DRAFT_479941 [Gamsiella multidivaricata]
MPTIEAVFVILSLSKAFEPPSNLLSDIDLRVGNMPVAYFESLSQLSPQFRQFIDNRQCKLIMCNINCIVTMTLRVPGSEGLLRPPSRAYFLSPPVPRPLLVCASPACASAASAHSRVDSSQHASRCGRDTAQSTPRRSPKSTVLCPVVKQDCTP